MEIYLLYAAVVIVGGALGSLFAWLARRDAEASGRRGVRRGSIRWGRVTEIRHHARNTRERTHDRTTRSRVIPIASHRLTEMTTRYRVQNLIEDTVLVTPGSTYGTAPK